MTERELCCPSAEAQPGALVIGMRRPDGTIGYLRDRLEATPDFVDALRSAGTADTGFRFAGPCARSGCGHWRAEDEGSEGRCGLIGRLRDVVPDALLADTLPRCTIRASCRWFAQDGAAACRVCPLVTRTSGAVAADDSTTEGHRA
jgi:hypothetical protein